MILAMVMTAAAMPLRAQKLSAAVDGVWLASGMFNGGVELTIGRSTTLTVSMLAAQHPWVHHDISGLAVQPELRRYLSGRPMYKLFVGLGAIAAGYDMTLDKGHYQGSAIGAGLTFGYVLPLALRWNLDLHSGFGLIHTEDRHQGNQNFTIPTKVGIAVSYIIM